MKFNKYLVAKELTVEQIEKVAEWVKISKEAKFNIDYGFAATPNVKTYEELAVSQWKDYNEFESEADKISFDEYLENEIERANKKINKKSYDEEAVEAFDKFEAVEDNFQNTINFRKFADNLLSGISKENHERYNAYRKAERQKRRSFKNTTVKVGVTGPIYDDENKPTYF